MDEWNCCQFIFAPWKASPAKTYIMKKKFIKDTNKHYFIDNNIYNNNDDESSIELIIGNQTSYSIQNISKLSIKIPTTKSVVIVDDKSPSSYKIDDDQVYYIPYPNILCLFICCIYL